MKNKTEAALKSIKIIENLETQISQLNDINTSFELRFFRDKGWSNFSINANHKPTIEYVKHQLNMDLNSKLKIEKLNLKTIASKL